MIDAKALLADLQKLLATLEDDIRRRCDSQPEVDRPLREQYAAAKAANRTAQAYEVWRDDQVTQAGVAWILGCVFVRFCEDNRLIDPPRLSGPGERLRRAEDEHTIYFQRHPKHSDREYLQWVFDQVAQLPAMKELFDRRHNPLWSLGVSGDGAMLLREFWQKRDAATGNLVHDFTNLDFAEPPSRQDWALDTRFLGDLYQDLSESARKKYALLQTPLFVERFILDRTLEPAIREFGFQQVQMIDPTCGSGHFLLGGFHRLFGLWASHDPSTNVRELARRALSQIYGVDLNPYAVAIARFRLLVAALRVCDVTRLDAADFASHMNLATGDSLLHGPRPDRLGRQTYMEGTDPLGHVYDAEDAPLLRRYLGQQYHAVVGNPPYITVEDKALNAAYRERFDSCFRAYHLSVPFIERFFDLALQGGSPGFVGIISDNAFMKGLFGRELVQKFMPRWDLTHIVDTRFAHIPGHGTPTVILFGRNRRPNTSTVRAVLGIRGESITPADPAEAPVWKAIEAGLNSSGFTNDFVSVVDLPREMLQVHPWSLGGGGAAELKQILDGVADNTLKDLIADSGAVALTRDDDAFVIGAREAQRLGISPTFVRPYVPGDAVRNWTFDTSIHAVWPYDERSLTADADLATYRVLWRFRTQLCRRVAFGKSQIERGLPWFAYSMLFGHRFRSPRQITFANVSTHNHFALAGGGVVFNAHAPVLIPSPELPQTEDLSLLGVLNSSAVCFWIRQVFQPKGGGGIGRGISTEAWEVRLEIDTTKLQNLPVVRGQVHQLSAEIHDLGSRLQAAEPAQLVAESVPTAEGLSKRKEERSAALARMISLQEELDWESYKSYGLLAHAPRHHSPPPLSPGERAFEIILAQQADAGTVDTAWFERTSASPLMELPAHWPEDYKDVVRRRLEIIRTDRNIGLIERPENKRRWDSTPWEKLRRTALEGWLLDRLEGWPLTRNGQRINGVRSLLWSSEHPGLLSAAQLADLLRQDHNFMQVAALYRGREDFDMTKLVTELVEDEAVPLLPVLRYKDSGLRNRRVWERVWDLQRLEDAIDARTKLPPADPQHLTEQQAKAEKGRQIGDIPVPPQYKSADMLTGTFWRLRGKLDMPKERFVSFPHCQRDADPTLVITWAGFDHLQQMQAVAAYYMGVKEREGWPAERRVPLLAGMLELLPWVLQWHNEVDPVHQLRMGHYYRDFINDEIRDMGQTGEQVRAWTPPSKAGGRGRKAKA